MNRGDIVTVVASRDYGKPRPAVVVQADVLAPLSSVVICLITSHQTDAGAIRIPLEPGPGTGLRQSSQIMVDKIVMVPRARLGAVIGRLDDETMLRLNRTLAFVMGLGQ
jgi:mRNA interferase MazF